MLILVCGSIASASSSDARASGLPIVDGSGRVVAFGEDLSVSKTRVSVGGVRVTKRVEYVPERVPVELFQDHLCIERRLFDTKTSATSATVGAKSMAGGMGVALTELERDRERDIDYEARIALIPQGQLPNNIGDQTRACVDINREDVVINTHIVPTEEIVVKTHTSTENKIVKSKLRTERVDILPTASVAVAVEKTDKTQPDSNTTQTQTQTHTHRRVASGASSVPLPA